MITSEKVPSAYDMVDDMGDMFESVSRLEKLNRLFHDGIKSLQDMRWGEMGSEAGYVPKLEQHVRGLR